MPKDPSFSLTQMMMPKINNDSETLKNNILTLLLMREGSYPSIPYLGINIINYLYDINFSIEVLKTKISRQCEEISKKIISNELDVKKVDQDTYFMIAIIIPAIIDTTKVKYLFGFRAYQDKRRVLDQQYEMDVRTFVQAE